ncbi:hypothetical protein GE09DRAFT_1181654 [Coniochaeta sp. 2T2.1]|nr:hypothetical protein GE09DRAFT_1181654 [Coniochaeta sp. 2T2.1]
MARLNEPAMSTDSIETLRRKFQRQNRDLARINSNQSLRIRELEAKQAEILSENFELRSHIFQLEKEIENGNAHRVADHALDLKAQLEAQLGIFQSLIEGLGTEPPRKRLSHHSPYTKRITKEYKPRLETQELVQKIREERAVEAAAAAQQESRLAAVPEHKPYPREPRATLNSQEIRALRGDPEPDSSTDSPILGPPPVSRFVEDEPVKVDSPSPRLVPAVLATATNETVVRQRSITPAPKLDLTQSATSSRAAAKERSENVPIKVERTANTGTLASTPQPLRAGAKRKHDIDEGEGFRILKQTDKQSKENAAPEKSRPVKEVPKQRSIKDLSAGKRELQNRATTPDVPLLNPRKALATKSANDSPRKVNQLVSADKVKPVKPVSNPPDEKSKQQPPQPADKPTSRPKKSSAPVLQIPLPQPEPPAPVSITTIPEPETPFPEPDELATPNTPDHSAPRLTARDTPPPGMGEGARPSRRARPAISYAEPNLRDKMRRPTKELFDAVAGEGKFKGRNSIAPPGTAQKPSDQVGSAARSVSSSKGKEVMPTETQMSAAEIAVAQEASRRASAMSPTPGASKELPDGDDELPSGITTQRRRRGSSMAPKDSLASSSMDALVASTSSSSPLHFTDKPAEKKETPPTVDDGDLYDFNSSSPVPAEKVEEVKTIKPRKSRASSSFQENGNGSLSSDVASKYTSTGRGQRASMAAALTKLSMLELEDTEESSLEGESVMKDRVVRRRSMML